MSIQAFLSTPLPEKNQFRPQVCPNPKCSNFGKTPIIQKWCKKIGFFTRENGDKIPRWLCLQGTNPHSFSYSAFECTYWLKHRDFLPKIAQALGEQSCLRGLARSLNVSQNCISGQVLRIGRHSVLVNQMSLKSIDANRLGTLVFDELESWEVSQYSPTTHPLFMDFESGFKLSLTCAPINRKGRKTPNQERKYKTWVKKYGKAQRNSSRNAIAQVLKHLRPLYVKKKEINIATDEKITYGIELSKNWNGLKYDHKKFNSKVNRDVGFMGKINQEDQYLRQRCSTMRRETLDFMRRHNNTCLRHAIYLIKRNFIMADSGTKRRINPAVKLNLIQKPIEWSNIFSQRLINEASKLPDYLQAIYFQKNRTPFYKNNQLHAPVFAI